LYKLYKIFIARGSAEGGGGEEAELQAGLAITKSCKALVKEVTVLRKRASAGTYAHARFGALSCECAPT
jgi:hypothetical protein